MERKFPACDRVNNPIPTPGDSFIIRAGQAQPKVVVTDNSTNEGKPLSTFLDNVPHACHAKSDLAELVFVLGGSYFHDYV